MDSFIGDDERGNDKYQFVDLISRDWTPSKPHVDRRTGKVYDDVLEPVEGCDRRDVGWMGVAARSTMVVMYDELRGYNDWETFYRRPFEVVVR